MQDKITPLKIAMLCYPTYGGSGIVATELGMELADQGHEVHFISNQLPARLDITQSNIYFHKVNLPPYPLFQYQPYEIALSSAIYRVAKTYRIDVLHAHYAIPYAYAAYTAKQMLSEEGIFIPLVTTLHGTDITLVGQHPSYRPAVEFSINRSEVITSVSESLKKDTVELFNIKKEIHVIPNFIDLNDYKNLHHPCQRQQMALPDEKILIHVSNLRPVKRIEDVLEIFYQVQKKLPCKLIIVGEGPEMERINEFMEQHPELLSKIRLLGKVGDIASVLRIADVFLLPSEQESFGLAALEAMAAGVPVISSDAGGIMEVNRDGETGWVSPIGNTQKMAEDCIALLSDEATLQCFKTKAKERALDFDIHHVVPQYVKVYQQALQQKF